MKTNLIKEYAKKIAAYSSLLELARERYESHIEWHRKGVTNDNWYLQKADYLKTNTIPRLENTIKNLSNNLLTTVTN